MKKIIVALISIVVCCLAFAGCGCEHVWQAATCEAPKTCENCGAVEGTATGHSWIQANCEAPKTCEVCKKTEGEALGHALEGQVTCTTGVQCSQCNKTIEAALGHQWQPATLEAPKTCTVCNETQGEPLAVIDVFPDGKSRHDGTAFLMTCEQFIELFDEYLNRVTMFDLPHTFPKLELNGDSYVRSYVISNSEAPDQIIRLTYDPTTERVTRIVVELGEDANYDEEANTEYLYNACVIYSVAHGATTPIELLDDMEKTLVKGYGSNVATGCLDGVSYRLEVRYHSITMEIWLGDK